MTVPFPGMQSSMALPGGGKEDTRVSTEYCWFARRKKDGLDAGGSGMLSQVWGTASHLWLLDSNSHQQEELK